MSSIIAIIGAGNLGSRHLQGLATLPLDSTFFIIDPSQHSLDTCQSRWKETGGLQKTIFLKEIPSDLRHVDCVILSSSADVRADIVRKLLSHTVVTNIVFEKVLFQNIDDYDSIASLLKQKEVTAWVNCPRRIWPVYSNFKNMIGDNARIHLHVSGTAWGLGCNSIHMLDLAAWLSGVNSYSIEYSLLDNDIIPSKRANFVEFTGMFGGKFENGSTFHIESLSTPNLPYTLTIKSGRASIIAHEDSDYYEIFDGKTWNSYKLEIPYQSQLSGNIVGHILHKKDCNLTPFFESADLHKPMMKMLLAHYNAATAGNTKICPIT